jgi:hypothetical protein
MQSSTTKTLLNSVFVGTDEQWDRIQDLVAKMNRLTIQATHFMKYHLLLHPDTNFTNEKCSAILLLLNNPTRSAAAAEFRESMQQFRILIDQRHEEIRNFYQIAIYHGNQICSQYLTNIQENLVKKIKSFVTNRIVTRFQDEVPDDITR